VADGQLTASVDIAEANDLILTEIDADLHLDFEHDFDRIDEAMNTAVRSRHCRAISAVSLTSTNALAVC
jgi:hypothetical protein